MLRSFLNLALFLLAMYLAGRYVLEYILPFLIGLVLALVLDPLVKSFEERLRMPRGVASALAILLFFIVLSLVLFVGLARVTVELATLSQDLPEIYMSVQETAQQLVSNMEHLVALLPTSANLAVDDWVRQLYITLGSWLQFMVASLQAFIFTGVPKFFVMVLVSMVATFFLSRDKRVVGRFLLGLAPPEWRAKLLEAQADVYRSTVGLINAQLFLVFLTTLATVVGLRVIGVQFALTVGTAAGLLDIIPVVGPAVIFIPWTAYLVITGSWPLALAIGALWAIVTGLRSVAQAYVIGERIGLHPLATLLALYLGARIFGAQGLVIGPLVAVLLKASIRSGMLSVFEYDSSSG